MADRKISDLTALTTPASGDYLPIVDISEVAAASKNKRITVEELLRGAPDGTAAAPSIAFESDPNTGIYSPGADQLAISTAGTGRLFIDSSGRLGIGTSSPGSTLHLLGAPAELRVESTTSSDGFIRFTNTSGSMSVGMSGASSNIFLLYDRTNNHTGYQFLGGASGWHIWYTNNLERARIDSSGRLGVGTSSPGEKLDISSGTNGTAAVVKIQDPAGRVIQIASPSSTTEAYIGTTTNHRLDFYTNNGVKATLDSSGRLLVGTSTNTGGSLFQVNDNRIRVATAKTPASAADTGSAGEICWDANYIYVCTATNTWKRTAIATW